MRIFSSVLAVVFAGLVVGCGAEAGDPAEGSPGDGSLAVEPAEISVVESFKLDGIDYSFIEVDGEIGLNVSAPLAAPFPQLTGAPGTGKLTMLEIFETLQPDKVPNEKLVASHAKEASALGRPDASVVRAQISTTQEKSEFSDSTGHWPDCITALRTAAGISGTDGTDWDHVGLLGNSGQNWQQAGSHMSKNAKSAGVCNGYFTPELTGWRFAVNKKVGTFGAWTTQLGPKAIGLDSLDTWIVNASASAFNMRVRTTAHPASLGYLDLEIISDL